MNKIYKIVIPLILLSFSTSCKNSITEQLNTVKKGMTYPASRSISIVQKNPSNIYNGVKNISSNTIHNVKTECSETEYVNSEKSANNKILEGALIKQDNGRFNSAETLNCQLKQIQVENEGKESGYVQDNIANSNNLKEWLNTSIPEEVVFQSEDTREVSEDKVSKNCPVISADDVISLNELKDLEVKFREPDEKPSGEGEGRKIDHKSVGEAFPTSLQDTYELIIKINKSLADMIEKMLSEGISCDDILEKAGLSGLAKNNSVESISRINIPYNPDEEYVLYKIIFCYPLDPEDYEGTKENQIYNESQIICEPNYYIKNLTLEANLFGDNIYDTLKLDKWYEKEIDWWWGNNEDDSIAGEGIIVAIIDTGIDYSYQELSENIISGWNFVDDNNDIMDHDGHGTNVARIINKIAPECKLMIIKAITDNGGEALNIARAIRYAVDNGADVINLSLGGNIESVFINDAIDYAFKNKCVIIAAAGNSSNDIPLFPAKNPKVISVMGSNMFSNMTYYTNRGADIIAPGNNIDLDNSCISGTSFSTPFASGAAARLLSKAYKDFFDKKTGRIHPISILFILKYDAIDANRGILNLPRDLFQQKFLVNCLKESVMCRILSAEPKDDEDGIIEITALAKYLNSGNYIFSLDYAEGINRGGKDAWKNIVKIHKNEISENEKFIWDIKGLPGGIYTIRLIGREYENSLGKLIEKNEIIIDRIIVKIDNQIVNKAEDTAFLFTPFCKMGNGYDARIEIINPDNKEAEITPIFYDKNRILGGNEIRSPLTSVGNYEIDLKRHLPSLFNEYEGPIGLEIKNYSQDISISLKLINANSGIVYYNDDFNVNDKMKNTESNFWGASWDPYVSTRIERDEYHNNYNEWCKKVEGEKDYGLVNNLKNMPRIPKEARLVLYNPTDEDGSVNIAFSADGEMFDTPYKIYSPNWYFSYPLGLSSHFYKVRICGRHSYQTPLELYKINDHRQIMYTEKCENEFRRLSCIYNPRFIHVYSLLTKLNDYNGENCGSYNIKWSSLVLPGSISIPARSYINIPAWAFIDKGGDYEKYGNKGRAPIDYYCANACMVTNVYPKGSVFGVIVHEEDGTVKKVIRLCPSQDNLLFSN